jgi:hypothetical protein
VVSLSGCYWIPFRLVDSHGSVIMVGKKAADQSSQYFEGYCETWVVCSRIPAQIRKGIVSRHPGAVDLSFTNIFRGR